MSSTPVLKRYFTYRLNTLSKLNDMASQAAYLRGTGLSLPEARCLSSIGSFPHLTVNQLAFEANLDKSHASRAAQALTDKGLVVKNTRAHDTRSVSLTLTASGKALWRKLMPLIERRNIELLQCLSDEQQATLLDLFDRILAHEQARQAGHRTPPGPSSSAPPEQPG